MRFPSELVIAAALTLVSSVGAAPESGRDADATMPQTRPQTGLAGSELADRLERAELLAGLTDVEGAGLVVHLRHSPRALKGVDRSTLEIHDQDVNAVLNALRLAGAEALAISDSRQTVVERILALSAVGPKDEGIIVNGTPFNAPYRIYALGDAAVMRAELFREGGVVKRAGLDSLQMIELESAAAMRIPACRTAISFKFARSQSPNPRRGVTQPLVASLPRTQTAPPEGALRTPVPAATPTGAASQAAATLPIGVEPEKAKPPVREAAVIRRLVAKNPSVPARSEKQPPVAARPQTVPETPAVVTAPSYFGGKELAKFHQSGCRFGERIEKPLRISFANLDAARKAGRIACKICLGDQTEH